MGKLSDVLSHAQKRNKIRNLLQALVQAKMIRNAGSRRYPNYDLVLAKESDS